MATGGKGGGFAKKPLTRKQRQAVHVAATRAKARQVRSNPTSTPQQRARAAGAANEAVKRKRISEQSVVPHGPVGFAAKVIGNVVEDAYNAPKGPIAIGKAVGEDIASTVHGKPTVKHTGRVGKAVATSTADTVRHPLRRPGDTLLLGLAAASAGAGSLSRLGSAGRALRAGDVKAAVARPSHKGGSLLHRKSPGEIDLPGGAQALEHDNPLLNVAKRARMRGVTKTIEQGKRPSALLPEKVAKETSAQGIVGRELRAAERVESDVRGAYGEATAQRLKKLRPGEREALRVLKIEGSRALSKPHETVDRHIRTHLGYAEKAQRRMEKLQARAAGHPKLQARLNRLQATVVRNREVAKDLEGARSVLAKPRREFLEAAAATRRLSRQQQQQLIAAGRLTPAAAEARIVKQAALYTKGQKLAPRGAFYSPEGERFQLTSKSVSGGPVSRRVGDTGIRAPQASRYTMGTLGHEFTGGGTKAGKVVQRPGEALVTRGRGLNRLESAVRMHKSFLRLSTASRRSEYDIPISKTLTPDVRRQVAALAEEAATGDATALVRAEKQLRELIAPHPGQPARYLDSRYIKEFAGSARGLTALAKANKPFRIGGVYARPAYTVTNRTQNFLMRHLAQGIRTHRPIHKTAAGIRKELGPEVSAKLDALGGEARTESYLPKRGVGRGVERVLVEKQQKLTDRDERFLAVLARAHEKGYQSLDDLRRLVADQAPETVAKERVAIGRRADKDMISFNSITPGERTLSDFVYFYPYLSRGSIWAGRFVAEHPVKSAAIQQFGQEANREGIGVPGPVPSWLKGYVKTRFGLVNLNPISTFSTPAQVADTARHPMGSLGEEFGTPIPSLLSTDPSQWPRQLLGSTAPTIALQRAGLIGKPAKTFPHTGIAEAVGPFVAGGLYPRHADEEQIKKQAERESPGSPSERAYRTVFKRRSAFHAEMERLGELSNGRMPSKLRQAFNIEAERQGMYAHAVDAAGAKPGTAAYHFAKFAADTHLLAKHHQIPAAEAAQMLGWAERHRADLDKLKDARRYLSETYYQGDGGPLALIGDSRKYLEQQGARGLR